MSISEKMLFTAVAFAAIYCTGSSASVATIVGELPPPIIADIYTILINGLVNALGNCTNSNEVSEVQYWLYTRPNSDQETVIDSSTMIDNRKPIVILIHGWGGNANIHYIKIIKDAYLSVFDWNIISVDYSVYVAGNYQSAYCYVPAIGNAIAEFLCTLTERLNVNTSSLHIVGHSLGAQVAGFAGKRAKELCGSIGRITGFDPAGPLYQNVNRASRLDKTDAALVDVIHTNQGQYGYIADCGHVDFYPNCGYFQPNCLNLKDITLPKLLNLTLAAVTCQHQRSCYLFAESISNDKFYATNCKSCGLPTCKSKQFFGVSHANMGESCRSKPRHREYTLRTNAESPYARG